MASSVIARAPRCVSCIRQLSSSLRDPFNVNARQQIRGKKKLARVSTIRVQLKQNVPGYGRRGAVIPVTPGVMRNIWYPKGMAEYMTATKLHELGVKKDSALERDSTFRSSTERKIEKQSEEPEQKEEEFEYVPPAPLIPSLEAAPEQRVPEIELEMMNPDKATSILEDLLPANLDFYRTTITIPKISPSISAASSISAQAAKTAKLHDVNKIHGSVSTSDIIANLKAILAEDSEGSRVVLSQENVQFVNETEDKDRVKQLGVFEIEIKLDGATDSIRRTIKVNAQS